MRLTQITDEDRKRRKIGGAVSYELELDHMGAAVGKRTASVYLDDALVLDAHDLLGTVASLARDSIRQQLWARLDAIVALLYAHDRTEQGLAEELAAGTDIFTAEREAASWREWGEARGVAQGLALALAILVNPRYPDVDRIRQEAAERYEATA